MNRKEFEREAYIYTQEKMVHYSADQNEVIEMLAEFAEKVQEKNAEDIKANCDYILEGKENEYREERNKLCDDFENMKAGLESQIAQLGERCNQLLKDKGNLTDKNKRLELIILGNQEEIADLEQENAELKEQIKQIEIVSDYNADQLAKAKDLIEDLYDRIPASHSYYYKDVMERARQFLKEIEKC